MSRINAASVLLLLMAVAGAAHAQFMPPMQPLLGMPAMVFPAMKIPEGAQVATATAFANGTGTATSFSSNNNGVTTGYTQSSGPGAFATAGTSGPSAKGCQVINQAQSGGCPDGVNNCCSTTQRIERCPGYSTAVASVNGQRGTCCVELQHIATKTPRLFCAAVSEHESYLRMPADVEIGLNPNCESGLTCTVTFPNSLPEGFTYRGDYTPQTPLTLYADKPFDGFKPCNGGFGKFSQIVTKQWPVTLTSRCN